MKAQQASQERDPTGSVSNNCSATDIAKHQVKDPSAH